MLMPLQLTVATIVQDKLVEMDVTQTQLAQLFGIGKSKVSQILNGKRLMPSRCSASASQGEAYTGQMSASRSDAMGPPGPS